MNRYGIETRSIYWTGPGILLSLPPTQPQIRAESVDLLIVVPSFTDGYLSADQSTDRGRPMVDHLNSACYARRVQTEDIAPLRRNVIQGTYGDLALPSIYMNGRYAGALDALDLVQVIEVAEVRDFRPATARMIYGAACACNGEVIDVTTRRLP